MQARITVYLLAPQDRPHWQAQWLDPHTGRRRTRSLKTADADEAERLRGDLEYEVNNGLHREPGRTSWAEFRDAYEAEHIGARRPRTLASWRSIADRFEREGAPARLAGVTTRAVSAHAARLRGAGMAPATITRHLAYLRAALRWAARQELLAACPRFEMPRCPRRRKIVTLGGADLAGLLAAMPGPPWRLLTLAAWHTGMRRGELFALRWERGPWPWVDWRTARVAIPAEACKADRDDWLPIHPELLAALEAARRESGPVCDVGLKDPSNASGRWRAHALAGGFDLRLHDLRRSFGTRYARAVPAQVLQRLMRHADIKTTLAYYVDQDLGLEEAIRRL